LAKGQTVLVAQTLLTMAPEVLVGQGVAMLLRQAPALRVTYMGLETYQRRDYLEAVVAALITLQMSRRPALMAR
jgi:hypothetical protein